VFVDVLIGVFVRVLVDVFVGVIVGVRVGVFVNALVGVFVALAVGVFVRVFVGVFVGVGVLVGVIVGAPVGVVIGVGVGVPDTSLKQTVTSFSVGVTVLSVVLRKAWYLKKRKPLNWASEAPLVVKNVPAVPSGPTKLNGPFALVLPATWNFKPVPAGVFAVQESVVQCAELPGFGFASFSDETSVPVDEKPGLM